MYKYYGGRGIFLYEKWLNSYNDFFEGLTNEIGSKPSNRHTIDRIDNNKGYLPGNIRWATRDEQFNNRSDNVVFYGKTLSQRAKFVGVGRSSFHKMYKKLGIDGAIEHYKNKTAKETYLGMTLNDIAKNLNVSYEAAKYHIDKGKSMKEVYEYFLNYKPKGIFRYEGLTVRQRAFLIGCREMSIRTKTYLEGITLEQSLKHFAKKNGFIL